jgi:hypothetical protein
VFLLYSSAPLLLFFHIRAKEFENEKHPVRPAETFLRRSAAGAVGYPCIPKDVARFGIRVIRRRTETSQGFSADG